MHPAGPLLVVAGAGSGKTRVITYRTGAPGRDAAPTRAASSPSPSPTRRPARCASASTSCSGTDGHRHARPVGRHLPRDRRAPPAPVRRGGRPAQGLRHLRRRRSEAAARARADRSQGARADVPGAPGAVGHRSRQEPGHRARPTSQLERLLRRRRRQGLPRSTRSGWRPPTPSTSATCCCRCCSSCAERHAGRARRSRERFDHVLVDEFQDTNSVQYRLVRLLSRRTNSITVVGDDDQSIYRWRGADIRNILDFERDHPGARVVKLEQNYRSTGQHPAPPPTRSSRRTRERRPKRLFTEAGRGRADRAVRGRDRARRGGVRRRPHRRRAVGDAGAARLRRLLPHQRAVARARRGAARARPAVRGRRRHALLRPRRDQGPARLPARGRQPRRRHRAAAHHQRPGARHRRRRPSSASATSSTSGKIAGLGGAGAGGASDEHDCSGRRPAQEARGVRRADDASCARGRGAGPGVAGREDPRGERLPRRAGRRGDDGGGGAHREPARARRLRCASTSARREEPTLHGFLERIALVVRRRRLRSRTRARSR